MFDVSKILYNQDTMQYTCSYQCSSPSDAEELCARYIRLSRMVPAGEMFTRESTALIGASAVDDVRKVAGAINANYFMPPLDVYVFYGRNRKGLQSRWCVGFDYPNPTHLIDFLNRQGSFINADNNPQSWQNSKGETYSIVMVIGVLEQVPAEDSQLNQRVNQCLGALEKITFRRLNPITIL